MSEHIASTLTLKYRSQWGVWEAIREIFTNSMDEIGDLPNMHTDNDVCIIEDQGEGMTKRQFLLLGISEKKERKNIIGQFGEGLKIGLVILLREGCNITISSQDWKCTVVKDMLEGEEVVAYDFDELDSPVKGVRYEIEGLNISEVQEMVASKFLPKESEHYIVNNERYGRMMTGPFVGKLYHKGVYIQEAPKKTEFGYDLFQLDLGTDRQYASSWSIGFQIGNVLEQLQDPEIISRVFDAMQKDTLESETRAMNMNDHWKRVFISKYGMKAVVSDDTEMRGKVAYNGGQMIKFATEEIVNAITGLGIMTAEAFVAKRQEARSKVLSKSFDEVSQRKKRNIKIAFGLVQKLNIFRTTFKDLVEADQLRFFTKKGDADRPFANRGGGNVWIPLDIIHDPIEVATALVHELCHRDYGYRDLSTELEQMQYRAMRELMRIAINYISPKTLEQSV